MTRDGGKRERRHPDAVAYPEGFGEEGAAVVPPYGGGEVRDLDVAEDGPPEALPAAVPSEFGPLLPRLAADLASDVPDLEGVERALPR